MRRAATQIAADGVGVAALTGGCDRARTADDVVVVEGGARTMPAPAAPAPTPSASPPVEQAAAAKIRRIELPRTPTLMAAMPAESLATHKTFTDPPLPAELKDDGGLTPLPPPPPIARRGTTGTGGMP